MQTKKISVMFSIKYTVFFMYFFKNVSSDLLVQTNDGPIQGTPSLAEGVEAFLGIPYAEPPVGDLRFAKPLPKKPWTKILHASTISSPCPQISIGDYYYTPYIGGMSEDCLYLNIWVTKPVSNNTLKPILIFFHPGGFSFGGSNLDVYDGSNLAKRGDVIVVTINYRLGPFGFLLAYIEEANGNMGMYDQLMAIKWMKINAEVFGGNPDNIVLMGQSAGAVSIGAHMLSPLSQHLFHKAIMQSGATAYPHLYDNNTKLFAISETLAFLTGCANDTMSLKTHPHAVVDCLKRHPVGAIIVAVRRIFNSNAIMFFPRVGDEFLPEHPRELLSDSKFRKDIPVLTGITSDQGTMFLTVLLPEYFGTYGQNASESFNKNHADFLARGIFGILKVSNASEIIDYYMSTVRKNNSVGYTKMLADIFGDYLVSCGNIFQAEFFSSKGNPVYFYKFASRSPATPLAEWMGTATMEEVQYVFGNPFHEEFTDEEVKLSNRLMDRWSTFAKTGDPNIPGEVPWLRYSYERPQYLSIQYEDEMIHQQPVERCKIWRTRFNALTDKIK